MQDLLVQGISLVGSLLILSNVAKVSCTFPSEWVS